MSVLEKGKEKIKDFIYDLFNPLILPYVYKLPKDFVSSYLFYLINEEENVYISKDGSYSLLYKISQDDWEEFVEFLSGCKFLGVFDYIGFSFTTEIESLDEKILFWVVKKMSIEPLDIESNFNKFLKARDILEDKFNEFGIFYTKVSTDYLLKYVDNISWYVLSDQYDGNNPISTCFYSPKIVLRDELFYSDKDLFFVYSIKSTYEDSLKNTLMCKPFDVRDFKSPLNCKLISTNTFLLKYEDKFKVRMVSFLLLKFVDGLRSFSNSRLFKKNELCECVDFSDLEGFVSLELVSRSNKYKVNFQREQKNLSFFYGVSCLPFNLPFDVNLKDTYRDFEVHWEV